GRPVCDKMLAGAIRGAYADVLPRDRHAVTALFIELDPALVDVNVHPAKADVRFRDPGLVRGLIVGAIRQALAGSGIRPATGGAQAMLQAFRAQGFQPRPSSSNYTAPAPRHEWSPQTAHPAHRPLAFHEDAQATIEAVAAP